VHFFHNVLRTGACPWNRPAHVSHPGLVCWLQVSTPSSPACSSRWCMCGGPSCCGCSWFGGNRWAAAQLYGFTCWAAAQHKPACASMCAVCMLTWDGNVYGAMVLLTEPVITTSANHQDTKLNLVYSCCRASRCTCPPLLRACWPSSSA
jgi:hypothetical protein